MLSSSLSEAPVAASQPSSHDAGHRLRHPAYRPDIDGLRALAVLAVVAFHAFPGSVGGGFVGVDIFFIISGFLISTILFANLATGTFDLVEFYVRRVRRIFPALIVVLLFTFGIGWFGLMGDEFAELGKQMAAGAGFVANLVFWNEAGYFDAAADTKLLLHLWSLGVEEQFYIVWPLLLMLSRRLRANPFVVTMLAAVASFALNVQLSGADATADFYSPLSRFWELSLGSMLAYGMVTRTGPFVSASPRMRDLQSLAGGVLLVLSVATIRSSDAFPGWWALMPTVGAVLLIASGSQAWVNHRVLSNRVLVWIGLISFPLYLWHWPILSFIRILAAERPGRTIRVVAVLVAIGLAWLTYRFVERPIRRSSPDRRPIVMLLVAMTVVGIVGVVCLRADGFAFRPAARLAVVTPGDLGHADFYAYSDAHFTPCEPQALRDEAERWNGSVRCLQSRAGPADLAIIGDSHAEHLFAGLAEALPARNVVFYTRSSVPVIENAAFDHVFAHVVADPHIRTVILTAWWSLRLTELPHGTTAATALQSTIATLVAAGKTVYLADDVPNFSFSPRLCKYASSELRLHRCVDDAAFFGKQSERYASLFADLARKEPRLRMLRTSPYFCDAKECSMAIDGRLAFRDSDHMNIEGSRYLGRRLVGANPALATP